MQDFSNQGHQIEEVDFVQYVRTLKKYRNPIFKLAFAITITVIIIQIMLIKFPSLIKSQHELSALVTIGKVNNTILQDPKTKIDAIATPGVQQYLLRNLQKKDSWWNRFPQLPDKYFTIKTADNLLTVTILLPKQSGPQRMLLDVITNYITTNHKELFEKQILMLDEQIKAFKTKQDLIKRTLKDYQITRDALNRTIANLSPSNNANAQTFQAYLPSRDEVNTKIDTLEAQLLDIDNELSRLNHVKEEAFPTSEEIISTIPPSYNISIQSILFPPLIGLILSLFIGALGAFIAEWLDKNKARL